MAAELSSPECPACGDAATEFYFCKEGYRHYQCAECGFLFVHPYPSPAALEWYYRGRYRLVDANYYPKARSRQRRCFWRSLRFARFVYGKAVLDIGCGGGFMVGVFARLGAAAVGVDLSQSSIDYANRHFKEGIFYCEPVTRFAERGLVFDFIFSSEVFEHLAGTHEIMDAIRKMSTVGTLVYVSAPDLSHPAVPKNVVDWIDIKPPEHLQFFTRKALVTLFRRFGFEIYREYRNRAPAHSRLFVRIA
jgi:cyclopropane fatty-acyl-phospholipid synthase-like methyltransferase